MKIIRDTSCIVSKSALMGFFGFLRFSPFPLLSWLWSVRAVPAVGGVEVTLDTAGLEGFRLRIPLPALDRDVVRRDPQAVEGVGLAARTGRGRGARLHDER